MELNSLGSARERIHTVRPESRERKDVLRCLFFSFSSHLALLLVRSLAPPSPLRYCATSYFHPFHLSEVSSRDRATQAGPPGVNGRARDCAGRVPCFSLPVNMLGNKYTCRYIHMYIPTYIHMCIHIYVHFQRRDVHVSYEDGSVGKKY